MKKIILCVDDEKIVLNSLKSQLKNKFGSQYRYEMAESASEAMEIIEEIHEEYESPVMLIIVSDWLMPEMKGDEFLIQVHEKYPNTIKMMLTGQADEDAIERARNYANLRKCLAKPWNEQELLEDIFNALEQK
jgi:CheY-like chemotaxis protein